MKLKVIILLISLLSGSIEAQTIHYNAFSHNDYERPRPLFDALSFQFNCVEADLWLIDGELYVSHDSVAPNPDITFEKLYLLPLVERIKKNGGKVYPDSDRPFYLMVDCKTDGEAMYPVLKKKLKPFESLFCHEKDGKLQESAVLFYLSGKSPRKAIAAETNRFIFLDGTIEDLGKGIPAVLMPVISDNYSKYIGWKGQGEIPAEKLENYRKRTLKEKMELTKSAGEQLLSNILPVVDNFERALKSMSTAKDVAALKEGVDLIGADDLKALSLILQNP